MKRSLVLFNSEAASQADVKKILAADGKLVKRPVLVMGATVLVGFKDDEWAGAFPR